MTKVIIIPESNLDSLYARTIQYLHDTYHTYPTSLSGIPVTEAEQATITYNDAMGRAQAADSLSSGGGRLAANGIG